MKQNSTFRNILIAISVALFSLPASAQLSLSAGAKADVDADKGADAAATADGDAAAPDASADAEPEDADTEAQEEVAPPPPPPAPEPEPVVEEAAPTDNSGTVEYDGGFVIKTNDGNSKLKINGIVKTNWIFMNDEFGVIDPNNGNPEAGTNHTMRSAFNLPYARLGLSGTFLSPKLGYMLMYDFAPQRLIYAYSTWTFIPKKLQIQVGLFKKPFARQYLTSSAKQMFINNPIGQMGAGLDTGVQLSNAFTSASGLEWAIGVFNGTRGAVVAPVNGDFSPVVVARIGYNNGIKGYSDTDFKGGPLRFGIGLSAETEFDHDDDNFTQHYLSLDGTIKVNGLAISAAGYMQSLAEEGFWDPQGNSQINNGLNGVGAYVQGSYLIKEMIEPCARYSFIHNYNVDDDLHQQITGGLGIHFFKNHKFKLQNELSLDIQRGPDTLMLAGDPDGEITAYQDIIFTTQLQWYF